MDLANEPTTNASFPCNRLVISGRLLVPRAIHIGSGQANLFTDATIRRDRRGLPYIPGSTLAGLLRSAAEDFAPYLCQDAAATVRRLFGRHRNDDPRYVAIGASSLLIEDAYLNERLPESIEIRDYVGIDRQRAAARAHLKYDREVTPGNTSYQFELGLEKPMLEDVRLLLAVLDFWSEYGVPLGARTTTGLGQVKIERSSLKFHALGFSHAEVLRSFLLDGGTEAKHLPAAAAISRQAIETHLKDLKTPDSPLPCREIFCPQHLAITVALMLEEPLLVKGSFPEVPDLPEDGDASAVERTSDAEFITTLEWQPASNSLQPARYIPGSSLKGVLRTRAEKIIRTINFYRDFADLEAAETDVEAEAKFKQRIAACAITHADDPNPRLQACFGNAELQNRAQKEIPEKLYSCSCLVCRLFGNSMMRGRLTCTEAAPSAMLTPKLFDHVAIDRFTGGAADVKKFDTRPVMPVISSQTAQPQPAFTFKLQLERPELWMLGLLGHLLKDLNSGDLRIGHATRRGYGRVRGYVTEAFLLALPGTDLLTACRDAGLETETIFASYGPYRRINLADWRTLFSAEPWVPDGPEQSLRQRPDVELLSQAEEAFQQLVKETEERESLGDFDDTSDHSDD